MEPASSKSMLCHQQDRYTKLGMPSEQQSHSHSMCDLLSGSPSSPDSHREWMSLIKQDLEKFSTSSGKNQESRVQSAASTKTAPKVSKWSQFLCEVDGEDVTTTVPLHDRQEGEESPGRWGSGPAGQKVSKSTS